MSSMQQQLGILETISALKAEIILNDSQGLGFYLTENTDVSTTKTKHLYFVEK